MSLACSVYGRLCVNAVCTGIVLLFGCNEEGRDGKRPSEDTADDVAELVARLPSLVVDEQARIDGDRFDLVPITWLGVSRSGTLAVLQPQDNNVRLFDRSGKTLGEFGRKGAGPGEFEFLARGGWLGDTLWVSDTDLRRITLISPQLTLGRVLSPRRIADPSAADTGELPSFPFTAPYALYQGDTLLVFAQWAAGDALGTAFRDFPLLRVTRDGVIQRVILRMRLNAGTSRINLASGTVWELAVPFFPHPLWAVAFDGSSAVVITMNTTGEHAGSCDIRGVDAKGTELFKRRIVFRPLPISQTTIDSSISQLLKAQPSARSIERELRNQLPPVYPPVVGLVLGTDGRIWIGLRPTRDGNPWLILDSRGRPIASVVIPKKLMLRAASAEQIWTTEQDDFGVESIVIHRISTDQRPKAKT